MEGSGGQYQFHNSSVVYNNAGLPAAKQPNIGQQKKSASVNPKSNDFGQRNNAPRQMISYQQHLSNPPSSKHQQQTTSPHPQKKGPTLYQMHMGKLSQNQQQPQTGTSTRNMSFPVVKLQGGREPNPNSTMKLLGLGSTQPQNTLIQQKSPQQQLTAQAAASLNNQILQQQQSSIANRTKSPLKKGHPPPLMPTNGSQTCKSQSPPLNFSGSSVALTEVIKPEFTTLSKVKKDISGGGSTIANQKYPINKEMRRSSAARNPDKDSSKATGVTSIEYPALQSFLSEHQENFDYAYTQQLSQLPQTQHVSSPVTPAPKRAPAQMAAINSILGGRKQAQQEKVDLQRSSFQTFLEMQQQQQKKYSSSTLNQNQIPVVVLNQQVTPDRVSLYNPEEIRSKQHTVATPIMTKLQANELQNQQATHDKRNKFYQNVDNKTVTSPGNSRLPSYYNSKGSSFGTNIRSSFMEKPEPEYLSQQYQAFLYASAENAKSNTMVPPDGGITPECDNSPTTGFMPQSNQIKREAQQRKRDNASAVLQKIRQSQKDKSAMYYNAGVTSPLKESEDKKSPLNPFAMAINKNGMPLNRDQNEIRELIENIENSFEPEQRMKLLRLLHDKVKRIQQSLVNQNQSNKQTIRKDSREKQQSPWPQINQQFADSNQESRGGDSALSPIPIIKKGKQLRVPSLPQSPPTSGISNILNQSQYSKFSHSQETRNSQPHVQTSVPDIGSYKAIQDFLISGYDKQQSSFGSPPTRDQLKAIQQTFRGAVQSVNQQGVMPSLEPGFQTPATDGGKAEGLVFPEAGGRQQNLGNMSYQNTLQQKQQKAQDGQNQYLSPQNNTIVREVNRARQQPQLIDPRAPQLPQTNPNSMHMVLNARPLMGSKPQANIAQPSPILSTRQAPLLPETTAVPDSTQYSKTSFSSLQQNDEGAHIYKELEERLKEVEPSAPEQMRDQFLDQMFKSPNSQMAFSAARHQLGQKHQEDLTQLVKMFSEFLFLSDCRALGILPAEFQETVLLKTLQESGQTPPRLSHEAHKILSFHQQFEGIKVDTLIIEVPLFVFQQTLIEPMFVLFGNKLLENLCDKIPVNGQQNISNVGNNVNSWCDFPSIEDNMTVYGRLKQYGLLKRQKKTGKNSKGMVKDDYSSLSETNEESAVVRKEFMNIQEDLSQYTTEGSRKKNDSNTRFQYNTPNDTPDATVKVRVAGGGPYQTVYEKVKLAREEQPPRQMSLLSRLNAKAVDKESPQILTNKSSQVNISFAQNNENDGSINVFSKALVGESKQNAKLNSLRASHKFKRAMRSNWERLFPKQTYVGNPLANGFSFTCIVKQSGLYDQLKEVYNTEQLKIHSIISEEGTDDSKVEEKKPVNLKPIVRTSDTSILEFISFCSMIGITKCPDVTKLLYRTVAGVAPRRNSRNSPEHEISKKYNKDMPSMAVSQVMIAPPHITPQSSQGATKTTSETCFSKQAYQILKNQPNVRKIALVIRENIKRSSVDPIQRYRNAGSSSIVQLNGQNDSMTKLVPMGHHGQQGHGHTQSNFGQAILKHVGSKKDIGKVDTESVPKLRQSPSFQHLQQVAIPNSMLPTGIMQQKAFIRHLSVAMNNGVPNATQIFGHSAAESAAFGKVEGIQMESFPVGSVMMTEQYKRLFEISDLERLGQQLITSHLRLIKRQNFQYKIQTKEVQHQMDLALAKKKKQKEKQAKVTDKYAPVISQIPPQKAIEAAEYIKNRRKDILNQERVQTIQNLSNAQSELTHNGTITGGKGKKQAHQMDDKTKIHLLHKPYLHLKKHSVNKCLRVYNEFIQLTFKANDFRKEVDMQFYNRLASLAYQIGIQLPPRRFLTMDHFKSGSRNAMVYKEILWFYMTNVLNASNDIPDYFVQKDESIKEERDTNKKLKKKGMKEESPEKPQIDKMNETGLMISNHIKPVQGAAIPAARASQVLAIDQVEPSQSSKKNESSAVAPPTIPPSFHSLYFRYRVAGANNPQLVRNIMKNRSWWYASASNTFQSNRQHKDAGQDNDNRPFGQHEPTYFDDINFLWTQWRRGKHTNQLKSKAEFDALVTPKDINSSKKHQNAHKLFSALHFQSVYNRIEHNYHLSNKKALFYNMKMYYEAMEEDPFMALPVTFHCEAGMDDLAFRDFLHYFQECEIESKKATKLIKDAAEERKRRRKLVLSLSTKNKKTTVTQTEEEYTEDESEYFDEVDNLNDEQRSRKEIKDAMVKSRNIWILKPGENSNRGHGINVASNLKEVKSLMVAYKRQGQTVILQKYISNPLLINRRKFDIRVFSIVTSHNGVLKSYFYKEGYLRTSCKEYNLTNLHSRMVHLTNDAVQQNSEDYGRYEPGNKLSYSDFQKYLNANYKDMCVDFERDLVPQIQKLVTDTIRATFHKLDQNRRINSFEIFGYDFMIDEDFKLYLIECNTNPCLELSAPLLGKLLPQMLDNAFRISIDPLFMPAKGFTSKKGSVGADTCPENRFELIFDELVDRPTLISLFEESGMMGLKTDEAQFNVSDEEDEEVEDENPQQQ